MPLFLLWGRRLWPYAAVAALVAIIMLAGALIRGRHETADLHRAHVVTVATADTVRIADTVFRHETVVAARAVTVYRAKRDTVLLHLTDTLAVKGALADCDSAIGSLSGALASAGRLIQAHVRYEHALATELAISERLRAPRYSLTSRAGMEWGTAVPVTELESSVRITERWSVVGLVSKRWAAGEPTRRLILASYSF